MSQLLIYIAGGMCGACGYQAANLMFGRSEETWLGVATGLAIALGLLIWGRLTA